LSAEGFIAALECPALGIVTTAAFGRHFDSSKTMSRRRGVVSSPLTRRTGIFNDPNSEQAHSVGEVEGYLQ